MALKVWLPLVQDTENYGIANLPSPSYQALTKGSNSGKIGNCYYGAGLIYHVGSELINDAFTVAMWVRKSGSFAANNDILFAKNSSTATTHIYFSIINGNTINLGINGTSQQFYISYAFQLDTWYHLAATYDGVNYALYINGKVVKSGTCTNAKQTGMYNICIGNRSNNAEGTYQAGGNTKYMNDFRLYDNCLTASQIKKISQGLTIHYSLSNSGIGNDNLIKQSYYHEAPWKNAISSYGVEFQGKQCMAVSHHTLYNQNINGIRDLFPNMTFEENTQYTISIEWGEDRTDGKYGNWYLRFLYTDGTATYVTSNGNHNLHKSKLTSTAGKTVQNVTTTYGNGGTSYFCNFKIEKGTEVTPYCPNYEDLGFDPTIEYDLSGNHYDAIKNNITSNSDTARNAGSSVFDDTQGGANNSYIKLDTNAWMVQGAPEMTYNLWAYANDWATETDGGRIISCTETGGFNIEGGASGYLRFPIDCYTNAEKTTRAYKYNNSGLKISDLTPGWHMITFVYTTTYQKVYLDGELYSTNNTTTYGLRYNLNARLFLGCEANTASPYAPYYSGKLSDFKLWYTALSDEDIKKLYDGGELE